jgi:hypothetical protein
MPLIKKADVKNYFAIRRQQGAHRRLATSVPDATGTSEIDARSTKPDLPQSEPVIFVEDFFAEHSSFPMARPASLQTPATSQSAQA